MDHFTCTWSEINYECFLNYIRKAESHSESWDVYLQAIVDCRYRGCFAILHFFGRGVPRLSLSFCFRGDGGVREELDAKGLPPGLSEYHVPMSEDVSHAFTELTPIDDVVMAEISNNSTFVELSWVALGYVRVSVMGAGDIGVMMLKEFIGKLKLVRLRGLLYCCHP